MIALKYHPPNKPKNTLHPNKMNPAHTSNSVNVRTYSFTLFKTCKHVYDLMLTSQNITYMIFDNLLYTLKLLILLMLQYITTETEDLQKTAKNNLRNPPPCCPSPDTTHFNLVFHRMEESCLDFCIS